jgi:membrane protein implicated in regulation of membrane protease activity
MYLVAIAWLYVAVMMSAAELFHPNGSWLGALVTLVMYGVAPLALVLYLLGTPARRRAQRQADAQATPQEAAKDEAEQPSSSG